jgi:hypothetical protein
MRFTDTPLACDEAEHRGSTYREAEASMKEIFMLPAARSIV